jgi:aspartate/methionine/tyrosine aminotransferase
MQINPSRRLENFNHYERPFTTKMAELRRAGEEIISFSGGDAAFLGYMPPEYVKEALVNAAKKNLTMYVDPGLIKRFREVVVAREKKVHGMFYSPEDIVWTNGVTHAHSLIYFSLLDPRDECILLEPAYHSLLEFGYIYPHKMIPVRGGVEENDWCLDPEDIREKITENTKILLMVNPNNPTGAVWDEKVVKEVVDIAGENDILIVSDEIYDLTVFDGLESVPTASLARDVPIITLNGMTKNWLVQGWRVGYMLFQDPEGRLQRYKEKFMDYVRYSLLMSPTMMAAAVEVFERSFEKGAMEHINALNRKLEKQRDYLWKRLNEMEGISCVKPRSGYFAFPSIGGTEKTWKNDGEFVIDLLEEGVYVRPGFIFGSKFGQGHVRVSFLLSIDEMRNGFDIWEEFMKKRVG